MSESEPSELYSEPDKPIRDSYLLDVLNYPFTRSGFPILVVGTLMVLVTNYATYLSAVGYVVWALIRFYLAALYFELINLSATDQENLYCFPDLSDFVDDIVFPAFKVFGVTFISFAPLIVWNLWGEPTHPFSIALELLGIAWAALYFPMAMLATVIFGTLLAASPHVILPVILRGSPLYLVTVALVFALTCTKVFSSYLFIGPAWLSQIAAAFLVIYVLMESARALGLFYVLREGELNWFYRREKEGPLTMACDPTRVINRVRSAT